MAKSPRSVPVSPGRSMLMSNALLCSWVDAVKRYALVVLYQWHRPTVLDVSGFPGALALEFQFGSCSMLWPTSCAPTPAKCDVHNILTCDLQCDGFRANVQGRSVA
jgi:hypothetical protein